MSGSPTASSESVSRRMKNTPQRDTPCELAVRRLLHARGMRYRVDLRPVKAIRRRADVVFTRARVAVFIDGCYWHRCPLHGSAPKANADWWRDKLDGNVRRDRDTDRFLTEAGWTVMRFWEHEDPTEAADKIERIVGSRRQIE